MKAFLIFVALVAVGTVIWLGSRRKQPLVQMIDPGKLSYSQLDITESFGDNERLSPDDWIATVALNTKVPDPVSSGLPPPSATEDEVYEVGAKMSALREQIPGLSDGVYCPICHIANTQIRRLKTPCPKCSRPLLKFGWD
jgi:hypothetical protein